MAIALEQFIKHLSDSGVLSAGKLENFIPPKAHPKDAQELAKALVKQKQLTKYQAGEVYQGRARSLVLGNYTILDRIGAGGMGQVFRAQHRRMDRIVAIKTLPKHVMHDAPTIARFEREVRAAAKLRHPNVVATDDADEAGGVHFLVMEFIDGTDLSALVKKNGPLSANKAINYVLQAARGLEYAHQRGVVHRDIKPANLLLNSEGAVKILDMGLARLNADGDAPTRAELTGTGAVMGTVDYMAPEQALSTKHADARADIYSLGCTLHYLVAGQPAYDGDTLMAKLLAHREKPIPSLGKNVPESVQDVFAKMVAKDVADRYQTMSEVVAALNECNAEPSMTLSIQQPAGSSSSSNVMTFLRNITLNTTHNPKTRLAKNTAPGATGKGGTTNRIRIAAAGSLLLLTSVAAFFVLGRGTKTPLQPAEGGRRPGEGASTVEPAGPPPTAKAPFDAAAARKHQEAWAKHLGTEIETTNAADMKMVLLPPGEFLMGSTDQQVEAALKKAAERGDDQWTQDRIRAAERPQHAVQSTRPLRISATEVTIGQFRKFIEDSKYVTLAEKLGGDTDSTDETKPGDMDRTWLTPGYAVTDDSPVTQVAWSDAAAMCNWLCEQEQLKPSYALDAREGWLLLPGASGYRLPTEAEWEYGCRAGTATQYWFGDDPAELAEYGWYNRNSGGGARAVALKLANPFGLYDMHGNVEEWCQDWQDDKWYENSPTEDPRGPPAGHNRVIRGGYWHYDAATCRCAFRHGLHGPALRFYYVGFRVVRDW